jgi:hypothetical protein
MFNLDDTENRRISKIAEEEEVCVIIGSSEDVILNEKEAHFINDNYLNGSIYQLENFDGIPMESFRLKEQVSVGFIY